MKSGSRLRRCIVATISQNRIESFAPSLSRVLLMPRDSGKSDGFGMSPTAPAATAVRVRTWPVRSGGCPRSSWELAVEDANATLQHRPLALGALGDHDQARVRDEEALAVALKVVSYLFALGNIDVLVDN